MKLEDKYEVIKELGRGGFGQVLLVRDRKHGQLFAAKVLSILDEYQRRAFAREVKQLIRYGRLRHVVRIVGTYLHAEPPFFIMAYAPGGAITPWAGKLALGQVLTVMRQLTETLAQMHAEGGFHRDIKPDNLLLLSDGTTAVGDFGLGNNPRCTVHFTMSAGGTIGYAAPELLGGLPHTPASDMYSAGATWFHLVTGTHPSGIALPLDPRKIRPATPDWVCDAITRMTAVRPEDRPTAFSVLRLLAGALRGKDEKLPVAAPPNPARWVFPLLGAAAIIGFVVLAKSK